MSIRPPSLWLTVDAFLAAADLAPESIRRYRDVLWGFADTVDQLELGQIERHH